MSNKKALFKREDYINENAKCNYIISTTKSWKCKNDFIKRRNRLIKEIKEYDSYHI